MLATSPAGRRITIAAAAAALIPIASLAAQQEQRPVTAPAQTRTASGSSSGGAAATRRGPTPPVGRAVATAARPPAVDTMLFNGMKYRMIGPFRGGRSTSVAGIAEQPYTFYQGSTGGGVWRTDDAGTSWKPVSDGFFGGSIGAIDVADSDPNVVYVGTGSACIRGNTSTGHGVWKTTDAGKTWQFVGLPEAGQVARLVVHPRDPDLVYVAALGHPFGKNRERGIFRSKDGGASWQHVLALSDSTGASDISMNVRNPRVLYAGMWRGERKPWTLISGSGESGVYRSTDGGDTWKKLAGGLPTGIVGKVAVVVSPANPERVWALVEAEPAGGVYRSDDGGETWTRTNSENKLRQRAWYYTHLTADPGNENVVYALNTSLYRSVDGGKTFEGIDVPHGDVHDLWINPSNTRVMGVADDGGAQVTLTNGKTWSTMNNQPTAELYDAVVDNQFPYRVYSSQQDNTTISVPSFSTPASLHPTADWRYAAGCETGPVALHPDHPDMVWGGCYGGAINRMNVRTGERRNVVLYPQLQLGQAAKDLKYRFQWVAPIHVSRHDPSTVYHASQHVHRTRDGGMTWETISPDLTTNTAEHLEASGGPINNDVTGVEIFNTVFALAEDHRDRNVLWAGTDDGRVHVTRDGGATWRDVTPRAMPRFATVNRIELSPHAQGRAYLAVQRYRMDDFRPYVFRTDDWGATWTPLTDGIPANYPVRVVREDPSREGVLFAGTEFGVFASLDGGRRWQPLQLNLPVVPVTDMKVHQGDLVVSTQGRSLYILDDVSPLRELAAAVPTTRAHLYTPRDAIRAEYGSGAAGTEAYAPDPYEGGATFHYWLAADADSAQPVTLDVLDAAGKVVRSWSSDTAKARTLRSRALGTKRGMQRVGWDLTWTGPAPVKDAVIWGYNGGVKAAPGQYQVRLTANGVTQTRGFAVRADPRIQPAVAQADYEEQVRVATAVRDTMNAVAGAIETLRQVREQAARSVELAGRIDRAEGLKPAADSLKQKLGEVEGSLIQTRSQSGQDPIRFAGKLDNQLAELYGNLTGNEGYISGGVEGKPTAGALERWQILQREWAPLSARVRQIIEVDVPAFNALAARIGVAPIVLPPRTPIS